MIDDATPIIPQPTGEAAPIAETAPLPDLVEVVGEVVEVIAIVPVEPERPRWLGKIRCAACGGEGRADVIEGGVPLDPQASLACPAGCPTGVYHLMGHQVVG